MITHGGINWIISISIFYNFGFALLLYFCFCFHSISPFVVYYTHIGFESKKFFKTFFSPVPLEAPTPLG